MLLITRLLALRSHPIQVIVTTACPTHGIEHSDPLVPRISLCLKLRGEGRLGGRGCFSKDWGGTTRQLLRFRSLPTGLFHLIVPTDPPGDCGTSLQGPPSSNALLGNPVEATAWGTAKVDDCGLGPAQVTERRRYIDRLASFTRLLCIGVPTSVDLLSLASQRVKTCSCQ